MAARVDRAFALITWVVAAVLVVMLLFGPAVVAHDRSAAVSSPYGGGTSPYSGTGAARAKSLFVSNCGSCHTLAAAGTNGQIGPNLNQVALTPAQVAAQVRQGGGGMPAFAGRLSDRDISALSAFVAHSR